LLPSSAGLAAALIEGGYGRAGLGASLIAGGYGRAGLGQTGSAVDEDLAAASEVLETVRQLDPRDGRTGQRRAQVDEYGRPVMPGVLARSNVLDASEGGNYSGGSNYAPGLPLLPSSSGLAGFNGALAELQAHDDLDAVNMPMPAQVIKFASKARVAALRGQAMGLAKRMRNMTPQQRAQSAAKLNALGRGLAQARQIRRAVYARSPGVGPNFAMHQPMWAR
jgi:hypothetical protein